MIVQTVCAHDLRGGLGWVAERVGGNTAVAHTLDFLFRFFSFVLLGRNEVVVAMAWMVSGV